MKKLLVALVVLVSVTVASAQTQEPVKKDCSAKKECGVKKTSGSCCDQTSKAKTSVSTKKTTVKKV